MPAAMDATRLSSTVTPSPWRSPAPLGVLVQNSVAVSGDMMRDFVGMPQTTLSGAFVDAGVGPGNDIEISTPRAGQVASAATDAAGHYQVSLGAGTYHSAFFVPAPRGRALQLVERLLLQPRRHRHYDY